MMPQKPELERDDDEDGSTASREDESAFEPEDDSDLGLDDSDDSVGLDSDTGTGEPIEGEAAIQEEDEPSWLEDSWGIADQDTADEEFDEDDDDSLIEGSEPAFDAGRDDLDADELEPTDGEALSDAGEEGFGDDASLDDLEVGGLPPLDAGGQEDAELEAELLAEEALAVGDEAESALTPAAVTSDALQADWSPMLDAGVPLDALVAVGAIGLARAKGGLWIARAAEDQAELCFASAEPVRALAAMIWRDTLAIGLATPSGLFGSRDGGAHFEALGGLAEVRAPISAIAWTEGERGPRLWAGLADGGLLASDDFGASFVSVRRDVAVWRLRTIERGRGLLALGRGTGSWPIALRSLPAGEQWLAIDLPVPEIERIQDLQACGDALLCVRRSPSPQLLWRAERGDWKELEPGASAPALLLEEGGDPCAYYLLAAPRPRLLRRTLTRNGASEVVGELPPEAGRALQLCGEHTDGTTTLQIGAERAWYRVRLAIR